MQTTAARLAAVGWARTPDRQTIGEAAAKARAATIYRAPEIIGTSPTSWEEGARTAVEIAGKSLRDLRVAEVIKLDIKVENGKIAAYRARISLSFKYDA